MLTHILMLIFNTTHFNIFLLRKINKKMKNFFNYLIIFTLKIEMKNNILMYPINLKMMNNYHNNKFNLIPQKNNNLFKKIFLNLSNMI